MGSCVKQMLSCNGCRPALWPRGNWRLWVKLVSGVAHEMSNPLNFVKNFTEGSLARAVQRAGRDGGELPGSYVGKRRSFAGRDQSGVDRQFGARAIQWRTGFRHRGAYAWIGRRWRRTGLDRSEFRVAAGSAIGVAVGAGSGGRRRGRPRRWCGGRLRRRWRKRRRLGTRGRFGRRYRGVIALV